MILRFTPMIFVLDVNLRKEGRRLLNEVKKKLPKKLQNVWNVAIFIFFTYFLSIYLMLLNDEYIMYYCIAMYV